LTHAIRRQGDDGTAGRPSAVPFPGRREIEYFICTELPCQKKVYSMFSVAPSASGSTTLHATCSLLLEICLIGSSRSGSTLSCLSRSPCVRLGSAGPS
jgi:hypothetical protein